MYTTTPLSYRDYTATTDGSAYGVVNEPSLPADRLYLDPHQARQPAAHGTEPQCARCARRVAYRHAHVQRIPRTRIFSQKDSPCRKLLKYTLIGLAVLILTPVALVTYLYLSADMRTPTHAPTTTEHALSTDSLRLYRGNFLAPQSQRIVGVEGTRQRIRAWRSHRKARPRPAPLSGESIR